jgi:uncharacterized membrane protein
MDNRVIRRKKMIKIVASVLIGGLIGFAYYKFVGCRTGACMITSNPYISTIYGAVMGGLIASIL